jgi:hypothetical protein
MLVHESRERHAYVSPYSKRDPEKSERTSQIIPLTQDS